MSARQASRRSSMPVATTPATTPTSLSRVKTISRVANDVKRMSVVTRSLEPELSVPLEEPNVGAESVEDGGGFIPVEDGGGFIQLRAVVRVRPLQRRALESKDDMQRDLAVNGMSVVSSTGSCALPRADNVTAPHTYSAA